MTRYIRLQETRQLRREGADWLQIAVGTAIYVGLIILACHLVP